MEFRLLFKLSQPYFAMCIIVQREYLLGSRIPLAQVYQNLMNLEMVVFLEACLSQLGKALRICQAAGLEQPQIAEAPANVPIIPVQPELFRRTSKLKTSKIPKRAP